MKKLIQSAAILFFIASVAGCATHSDSANATSDAKTEKSPDFFNTGIVETISDTQTYPVKLITPLIK